MKKNIYLTSLFCGLLAWGITSCDNPGEPNFDDDQYSSVLYLKDYGVVEVEFYNINEDVPYSTNIAKGGTNPSITRTASLNVLTQEELKAYNEVNGTTFEALPSDCYEFTKDFSFDAPSESRLVNVTLKAKIGTLDKNTQFVLPLRLTSQELSVNEKKQMLIVKPKVITPKVLPSIIGKREPVRLSIHEENTKATALVPLQMNMDNKGWSFGVECETDQDILKSLVEKYMAQTGEEYKVLPAENYELPVITFSKEESRKDMSINIDRTGLAVGEYLLPIALKEVTGMPFEVDPQAVCYVSVIIDNQIKISANDVYANSNQDTGTEKTLVDGKIEASWQSLWCVASNQKPTKPLCDKKYGVYVDINNITDITQFFKLRMTAKASNNYPKHVKIYTKSSTNEDWKEVADISEAYPNFDQKPNSEISYFNSGKVIAVRISFLTNKKNSDLTNIRYTSESGGWAYIDPNVGMAEIELWGE